MYVALISALLFKELFNIAIFSTYKNIIVFSVLIIIWTIIIDYLIQFLRNLTIENNCIQIGFQKILIRDILQIEYKKVRLYGDARSFNFKPTTLGIVINHSTIKKTILIPERYYRFEKLVDAIMEWAKNNNIQVNDERGVI